MSKGKREKRKSWLKARMGRSLKHAAKSIPDAVRDEVLHGDDHPDVMDIAADKVIEGMEEMMSCDGLCPGDAELMDEIAVERAEEALRAFINGLSHMADRSANIWDSVRDAIESEYESGTLCVRAGDLYPMCPADEADSLRLGISGVYVIDFLDDGWALVCPFENLAMRALRYRPDPNYDAVFVGFAENPFTLAQGKMVIRPWLGARIPLSAIQTRPIIRLFPEQHQRVVNALADYSRGVTVGWSAPRLFHGYELAWNRCITALGGNRV